MSEESVDLVVIGAGPGGEALAGGAAAAGLSVVVVDKHLVGGECPYYGCIPSKMMLRAGNTLAEAGYADQLAGDVEVTPSWAPVAARIRTDATSDWDDAAAVQSLQDAGATVLHGIARLDGPGRVTVELPDGSAGPTYVASKGVVLNPGTRPAAPPVEGLSETPYWTNRDAVQVESLPGTLVVLGGGPIGCEMAQAFARFGVRVTIVQRGQRLLKGDEPEASAMLEDVLVQEGLRVMTGAEATKVSYADGTFTVTLDDGEELSADKLLVAAGRTPNLDDLGLESLGLDPAARSIEVDERLRAGEKLWVVGDVTGKGGYTHVSMYQSEVARRDITGEDGPPARYHAVPHTTFTEPEVAGVGMTEQQARDAGLSVRTGSGGLGSRAMTHGPGATGLIKVVEDADRGVLVGATVVGPYGGEIMGFLAVAVHAEVPVATLETMITAFPTFHRAILSAVGDLS